MKTFSEYSFFYFIINFIQFQTLQSSWCQVLLLLVIVNNQCPLVIELIDRSNDLFLVTV